MLGDNYPPTAFSFKVAFAASKGLSDTSFQDVAGIEATIETETYRELGENGFEYHFPKPPTYPNLELKRGIAGIDSPLVQWCQSVFEGEFTQPLKPMDIVVSLMDENGLPKRVWSFANAYPVSWSVDAFNSTKNEVAIETIKLHYNFLNRML